MKKHNLLIVLLFISFTTITNAQDWIVQLGAFESRVSTDYFKGLSNIQQVTDHNDIHKYYIPGFATQADAEKVANDAVNMGFRAYTINLAERKLVCAQSCEAPIDPVNLKWIFFDFDRSKLRSRSRGELEKLVSILNANPNYTVELRAHTDAKGSLEYNEKLSIRRAESAKQYLLNRGISTSRLSTSTFGENAPIAKNVLSNGRDTEEGRQFNRRVELRIFDGQNTPLNHLVEEANVPSHLKS